MQSELAKELPAKLSYTVKECCSAVGIGRSTLYRFIAGGQITPIKIGGRVVIPRAEVSKMLSGELAGM